MVKKNIECALQGILVSVVVTPLSEYIVINHMNSLTESLNKNIFCLAKSPIYTKELTNKIKDVLMKTPDYEIDEDIDLRGIHKIPAGKIKDLLDREFIHTLAQKTQIKEIENMNKYNLKIMDAFYDLEAYKRAAMTGVCNIILEQLINKSAPDKLQLINEDAPCIMELNKDKLILIDGGIHSNCGFGVANAFSYEILSTGTELKHTSYFPHYTLNLQQPQERGFKFLSPGDIVGNDLKELENEGKALFFDFYDKPAMLYKKNK